MHIPNKEDENLVISPDTPAIRSAGVCRIAWRQREVTDSVRPQPCCQNYLLIQPSVPVSSCDCSQSDQCCTPGHRCAVSHPITHNPHPVSSQSDLVLLLVDFVYSNHAENSAMVPCDKKYAFVEEKLRTSCYLPGCEELKGLHLTKSWFKLRHYR